MQGILHADKSEKSYKILFTVFFWMIFFSFLYFGLNSTFLLSLLVSFISAHTLNWMLNCNFSVLFVHRMKWRKTSKKKLFDQLFEIRNRFEEIINKEWILYSVSHGGICRGTLNEHSDIDVSIIRKPGLKNFMKAAIFYVKEKKRADLKGVPLDIFICDTPENCIQRSKGQNNPIVIFDPWNKIDVFYPQKLKITIEDAQLLNEVSRNVKY